MTSRYDTGAANNASSTTSGSSTGQATSDTSQSSSTNQSSRQTTDQQYMSAIGRKALDQIIVQLAAGGTPEQRAMQEDVLRTLQQIEIQRAEYSKEAAFSDSDAAMQTQLQRALESTLPSVLLAQASAGTSGDAISALLTQDLTARAAGEAATIGLDASTAYGQISSGLLGTQLDGQLQMGDPALEALLQALQIDAGSQQSGTTTERSSGSQRTNTSQRTSESRTSSQTTKPTSRAQADDSSLGFSVVSGRS